MMQRRQEAERARSLQYDATLRRVSSAARPPHDFTRALEEAHRGLGNALRDGASWRPHLKTRDPGRLRLAAARHLFASYPVPPHLEQVWLDADGLDDREILLRKRWYVTVAGGGSLYKAGAAEWLSRKEVHWFLNAPAGLGFDGALWCAVARTYTNDAGIAGRIARSKIARTPRQDLPFWRETARFFCTNPSTVEQIDDLCDYIAAQRQRDRAFSLAGRTLVSLTRRMHEWHRDVAMVGRIEAAQRAFRAIGKEAPHPAGWSGSPLADWSWQPPDREARDRREQFTITQLVTASELVAESRAMHHCVWTYAQKCIAGQASIWSMRLRTPKRVDRMLTIELDRQHRAVQVRGFANRLATAAELQVLGRWAKAKGIALLTR
jgi:hypothetical protein